MKHAFIKKNMYISMVVVSFVGMPCIASDLVWTGAQSALWARNLANTANWTNAATGVACSFTKNDYSDNVYFSDRYTTVTTVETAGDTLRPGNIVFDIDDVFTLHFLSSGIREHIKSFTKRGPGVLNLSRSSGSNLMYCGMDIEAGRVDLLSANCSKNSIIGYQASNTTITVAQDAELRVYERGGIALLDATDRTDGSFGARIVLNGGTFSIMETRDGSTQSANSVKDLTFNGGTLLLRGVGVNPPTYNYPILRVADKVTVTGTTPPTIDFSNLSEQRWMLDWQHPTEFYVEDLDEDDAVDFDFPLLFCNYTKASETYPCGAFLKTGAGVMRKTSYADEFCADIEIREGTLLLDAAEKDLDPEGKMPYSFCGDIAHTFLGTLTLPGRQILVTTNGTLFLNQRSMLARFPIPADASSFKTPIVIRGGTLKLSEKGTPNTFGPLVFDDGNFSYVAGRSGMVGMAGAWGTVKITGTTPAVWPSVTCGYWYLMPEYATTFEVDDITQDGDVDFDFGLWLTIPYTHGSDYGEIGFTKTGAGTMRISKNHEKIIHTGGSKLDSYTDYLGFLGEARVNAGALQVDGSIASNMVKVASGAFLAGTGTVGRATLAAGAGFAPRVGQAAPLKILGDLTVGATGTVDLQVAKEDSDKRCAVDFAEIGGQIVSDSDNPFAGWTVTVNGQPTTDVGRIRLVGNVLRCSVSRGLVLIFR